MKSILLLVLAVVVHSDENNLLDLTKLDANDKHVDPIIDQQNNRQPNVFGILDALNSALHPLGPLHHATRHGVIVKQMPDLLDNFFKDDFFKFEPSNFLRKSKGGKTVTEQTTQTMKDGTVVHTVVTHHSESSHPHSSKTKKKHKVHHEQHKQSEQKNKENYVDKIEPHNDDKHDVESQSIQSSSQQQQQNQSSNFVLYLIIIVLLFLVAVYYRKFQVVNEKHEKINYQIVEQKEN